MKVKQQPLKTIYALIGLLLAGVFYLFFNIGVLNGLSQSLAVFSLGFREESYTALQFLSGISVYRENREQLRENITYLLAENKRLLSENSQLKQRMSELKQWEKFSSFGQDYPTVPVRVIGRSTENYGEIIINKGGQDNIRDGDVMVIDNYAVGEVVAVTEFAARVRTIFAAESVVPVISEINETKGLLKADLLTGIKMEEIAVNRIITEDENIITSGVDSVFPYGYLVGKVKNTEEIPAQATKSVRIEPFVDFSRLDSGFVLLKGDLP